MANDEQIGKVFRAVASNLRQCLVCEQLFTRRAAAEHAKVNCCPATGSWLLEPEGGRYVTH